METSFTGICNPKSMFPTQNGNSLSELQHCSRGKDAAPVDESSDCYTMERDGNGSDMDISEDYPSETLATARKDSTFSVPVIRVEDWSSSESDMEDDIEDSSPPFCFVGTREKSATEPFKRRYRSSSI